MKIFDPEYIFYHIPKCGGTTLRHFLYKIFINKYNDNQIYLPQAFPDDYERICHYAGANANLVNQEQYEHNLNMQRSLPFPPEYKVILCHVTRSIASKLVCSSSANPTTMTVLRHPVLRLISHYNHFNHEENQKPHINELNKDTLARLCQQYGDLMCKYLIDGDSRDPETIYNAIDSIDNVYILEKLKLNKIQHDVATTFGIPGKNIKKIKVSNSNVRNSKNKTMPLVVDVMNELMRDTPDMLMYNYVLSKLY